MSNMSCTVGSPGSIDNDNDDILSYIHTNYYCLSCMQTIFDRRTLGPHVLVLYIYNEPSTFKIHFGSVYLLFIGPQQKSLFWWILIVNLKIDINNLYPDVKYFDAAHYQFTEQKVWNWKTSLFWWSILTKIQNQSVAKTGISNLQIVRYSLTQAKLIIGENAFIRYLLFSCFVHFGNFKELNRLDRDYHTHTH